MNTAKNPDNKNEKKMVMEDSATARSFIHQGENKVGDSMNKKTIYIVVAVLVVIIVAAGVGIWLLYYNGTTPTATPSVVGASTLQFSVNETTNGALVTYEFAGKNVNTSSLMLKVDIPGGSAGNYSYVLNVSQQKSWDSINGGTWTEGNFTTDWSTWGAAWYNYVNNLVNWSGTGDYSYTSTSGSTITIYNIVVNPTIPDSTFQTS
jgi:hypothetical protein